MDAARHDLREGLAALHGCGSAWAKTLLPSPTARCCSGPTESRAVGAQRARVEIAAATLSRCRSSGRQRIALGRKAPLPSWPSLFRPQQCSAPAVVMPHPNATPVVTVLNVRVVLASTGTVLHRGSEVEVPQGSMSSVTSCPSCPAPQQESVPPVSRAQLNWKPELTLLNAHPESFAARRIRIRTSCCQFSEDMKPQHRAVPEASIAQLWVAPASNADTVSAVPPARTGVWLHGAPLHVSLTVSTPSTDVGLVPQQYAPSSVPIAHVWNSPPTIDPNVVWPLTLTGVPELSSGVMAPIGRRVQSPTPHLAIGFQATRVVLPAARLVN